MSSGSPTVDDLHADKALIRASRSRRVPNPVVHPTHINKPAPERSVVPNRPAFRVTIRSQSGCSDSSWRSSLSYPEAWIIERESGFSTTDPNPNSTAFGLGQLLDYNRAQYGARLGVSPDTTDPCAQIAMFRMYVADRYGTAYNAMSFWRAHSWY